MKKFLLSLLMLCCLTAAWAGPVGDGSYTAASMKELTDAIGSGTSNARIKLTADIYMSDLGEGDAGRHTLCSTFSGTLDGDGHTIWAARPEVTHNSTGHYHRQYLFTYSDGATFKNLTFKNFRVQSVDHHNQAIITSQAKNGCVFENITFDHVSTYTGDEHDNTGAAVGYATTNCTFKNITVRNSDLTADASHSGAVVGHAKHCNFENITVEHCESTARREMSGGVVGRSDTCTINNVKILDSYIKTDGKIVGGIAGEMYGSHVTNCTIDDRTCVFADGSGSDACAGGITGHTEASEIHDCINSALIAADAGAVGGIAGSALEESDEGTIIENCLNTGMLLSIKKDKIYDYYIKYKNKQLPCVTKSYNGIEYVVRKTDLGDSSDSEFGGIAGVLNSSTMSICANIGSMNGMNSAGGLVGLVIGESTISDCLSDVDTPSTKVKGLFGDFDNSSSCKYTITNCLNATRAANDNGDHSKATFVTNNILSYLSNTHERNELTWGKACLTLGEDWQQNIGIDPYPMPIGNKAVYHSRSITNEYGTALLPFSADSNEDIRFYTFEGESTDAAGICLKFTYVEHVPAHTPVLFRASGSPTKENPLNITINDAHGDYQWNDSYTEPAGWGMVGTYQQRVIDGNEAKSTYYLSDGVFKNAVKVTFPACRAYLRGPSIDTLTSNVTSQTKAVKFVLAGENCETTDLELVGDELVPVQQGGKSYSLMGTEVGEGYRGLLIRNGKKVIQNR